MIGKYGPHNPAETYVAHAFEEQLFETGEVQLNYARAGDPASPALLLVPGQTESWWGYEAAMQILKADFEVFAVDLRGQGRSSRTPGRYTLDNFGTDLVRFIDKKIGRPTVVSGLSSGGLMAAWLSAYGEPAMVYQVWSIERPSIAQSLAPHRRRGSKHQPNEARQDQSEWIDTKTGEDFTDRMNDPSVPSGRGHPGGGPNPRTAYGRPAI